MAAAANNPTSELLTRMFPPFERLARRAVFRWSRPRARSVERYLSVRSAAPKQTLARVCCERLRLAWTAVRGGLYNPAARKLTCRTSLEVLAEHHAAREADARSPAII